MGKENFKIEFRAGTEEKFTYHQVNGKNVNLLVPVGYNHEVDYPEIILEGPINENKFAKTLTDLKKSFRSASSFDKDVPVVIKLHSFGGGSMSGRGIFDSIKYLSKKYERGVQIEAFGPVMSVAALIMQAADIGGRKMSEHSRMLIHPTQGSYPQDAVNATLYVATMHELLMQQYSEIVAERVTMSGKKTSKEDIYTIMTANNNVGTYMSSSDALNLGLIDEII